MNISVECALLSGRDRLGGGGLYISSRIADTVLFYLQKKSNSLIHQFESSYLFGHSWTNDRLTDFSPKAPNKSILADPFLEFRMEKLLLFWLIINIEWFIGVLKAKQKDLFIYLSGYQENKKSELM